MITRLNIQGLALIDTLDIQFSEGFNVITGETGAGKSILIKALHFLAGAKTGADSVRKGHKQATVWGCFVAPSHHPVRRVLSEHGLPDDGEVLVRRVLNEKGKSSAWINDVPVTNTLLRNVTSSLVDVFAQHENQRLLDAAHHLNYLDRFLGPEGDGAKTKVGKLFADCGDCLSQLEKMVEQFQEKNRTRDYVAFRLDEVEKFNPSLEDHQSLTQKSAQARNWEKRRAAVERAIFALEGGEDSGGTGTSHALSEAGRVIAALIPQLVESERGPWESMLERLKAAQSELEEVSYFLSGQLVEPDATESAEAIEERIYGYQNLFRKLGVHDAEALLEEQARLKQEIQFLESAAVNAEALISELARLFGELKKACAVLTKLRKKAAQKLEADIATELTELAMKGAKLGVNFTDAHREVSSLDLSVFGAECEAEWAKVHPLMNSVTATGTERVHFLLASNPGEPYLPLDKIASGGELSRILLAIKKSIAADADTCVLVFDEIDTGISGRVADVVGKKLAELAQRFQVICISHLPQVAVYAQTHFRVEKHEQGSRTESSIVELSKEESEREIARLLSGAEVSTTSLANARTLIQKARAKKKTPELGARG